jgi:anthranilate synthase component 1
MANDQPNFEAFSAAAAATGRTDDAGQSVTLIPMCRRLMADQITAVLAYRRLVRPDDRMAPSFLLESVEGGQRQARYSYLGAQPVVQIIARDQQLQCIDPHKLTDLPAESKCADPFEQLNRITSNWKPAPIEGMPDFTGGWVGFAGYDTVRYLEGEKLTAPPADDRQLPDLHMGLYRDIVAFDHVQKTILLITHVLLDQHESTEMAYQAGTLRLDALMQRVQTPQPDGVSEMPTGVVDLTAPPPELQRSNMGQDGYTHAVEQAKQYIGAGDIFQVVLSQRFETATAADPFDIYRALRVVNPSPYMFYLQIQGAMLVGSSPEILCRVKDRKVVSRPLAGTRRRGHDDAEDKALETELLGDPKERSEHVMLVDLGRNDVGRVAQPGTIEIPRIMEIERYSHVMHISSTVTGMLRADANCWDALRVTLPVGTVSGAPKVRAMQIIDQLEPTRRGPYAGAVGCTDFHGNMDMAIALRTMVIMPNKDAANNSGNDAGKPWLVHLQAGAGIVADSVPHLEYKETVNKAAAMAKAIDLAEKAFL